MLLGTLLYIGFLAFLGGILVISRWAWRLGNVPAAINAIVSFLLALLPVGIEIVSVYFIVPRIEFGPTPPFAIALIGLLHSYGMLGPYDDIWWWDHLTHTLAAAFIATLLLSALTVTLAVSSLGIGILTIGFTLLVGAFWELLELVGREVGKQFGVEPILVHYGWRDTVFDLLFDIIGAALVVLAGFRPFVPIAEEFQAAVEWLLLSTALTASVGSLVLGAFVLLLRNR